MKLALPDSLRVKDVMCTDVLFLRTRSPVEAAWASLRKRGVSGAPVLNEDGFVTGVLSLADLADPRHHDPEAAITVDQIMTRLVYAVRKEDPLSSALRLMREEGIHRVFVVDESGRLVGVVVPMDILRHVHLEEGPRTEYVDLRAMQRTG